MPLPPAPTPAAMAAAAAVAHVVTAKAPPAVVAAAALRAAAAPAGPPPPPLSAQIAPLVEQQLLHPSCKEVRQQAAEALQRLHATRAELLPLLLRLLPSACGAGKSGKHYFTLFEDCLSQSSSLSGASSSGSPAAAAAAGSGGRRSGKEKDGSKASRGEVSAQALQQAVEAIGCELRVLSERLLVQQEVEGASLVNAGAQGFTLGRLVQLLQTVLGSSSSEAAAESCQREAAGGAPLILPAQQQQQLLRQVLWCCSALEALTVGRTSATKAAGRQLEQLLQERWMDGVTGDDAGSNPSDPARWQVARAASELLEPLQAAATNADALGGSGAPPAGPWLQHLCAPLLARLCTCVCPERAVPVYMLQLIKASSQQDFIPGSIGGGGLVSAAEVGGPLMRHVKNFVCRRLDMEGACARV